MKIGRYTIRGISKRFWAVLALIILFPIILFILWPQSEPAPYIIEPRPDQLSEFFLDPVASAEKLDRGNPKDDWYKIGNQEEEKQVVPGWDPLRYQNDTIQTKIHVPSQEQLEEIRQSRPSLVRQDTSGIQFYPVFVILPDNPLAPDSRSEWPTQFATSTEEPTPWIQLASEEILPQGEYTIRGLLYARSNALKKLSAAEVEADYPKWIPTVLLSEAVEISEAEAEAPADRRAEINVPVQYGDYELIIKSLEWSSGREARLCVGWRNSSLRPVAPFPSSQFVLTVDTDDFALVPREEEEFASYEQAPLQSGEPAEFSYWVVPSADVLPPDPQKIDILFRLPRSALSIPVSKIEVNMDDFEEPGSKDGYRWGGCVK